MDTGTCVISQSTSAQRKFYQWVLKWINGLHAHIDEEMRDIRHSTKLDVSVLATFLQAIGFKLLSFEKYNDPLIFKKNENNMKIEPEQGILKIAIECNISNMKAVLELGGITCQCPNSDHIKDASFWTISGTEPTGSIDNIAQKVEETGSNLLPRLSKDVTRVLRDVSYKLFDTIVYEPDVNRNTDINLNNSRTSNIFCERRITQDTSKKNVTRSHTQPEICFRTNNINLNSISEDQSKNTNLESSVSHTSQKGSTLQRQKTWDIETGSLDGEPRPSPPKLTSSPAILTELSKSLGQISLQSEIENPKNVTEYILRAQQNLEKALNVLLINKPKTSFDLSPFQDNDAASVKSAPANTAAIISPYKSTRPNIKSLSKLSHEQKIISGNLQIPKIQPTLSKPLTRRNLKLEQENSKSKVRRNSFYIPSPANSNTSLLKPSDTGKKFLESGRYSMSKINLTINSDLSNRNLIRTKKFTSPEQKNSASSNLETFNTNSRISMIKPPTKISKTTPIKMKTTPIKVKSIKSTNINSGTIKK